MADDNDLDPYWGYEDEDCWNCGGEGYVYGCSWDWQCDTWDGDSCLCSRRCDVCNPAKLTPEEQQQRAELQQALAEGIARTGDEA
jgi:hypothetical protein